MQQAVPGQGGECCVSSISSRAGQSTASQQQIPSLLLSTAAGASQGPDPPPAQPALGNGSSIFGGTEPNRNGANNKSLLRTCRSHHIAANGFIVTAPSGVARKCNFFVPINYRGEKSAVP